MNVRPSERLCRAALDLLDQARRRASAAQEIADWISVSELRQRAEQLLEAAERWERPQGPDPRDRELAEAGQDMAACSGAASLTLH